MTRKQALAFLGFMIGELGVGYHPDTPLSEYETSDESKFFNEAQIAKLQPIHNEMMSIIGKDAYDVGLYLADNILDMYWNR